MNQPDEQSTCDYAVATASTEPACAATAARDCDSAAIDPIGRRSPRDLPCHVHDPDLWFAESPGDLERAKALCASCPVRRECLAGALQRSEPCGVWGGEIVQRGQVVPFKRPRGRPRIHFPSARETDRPRAYAERGRRPVRRR